jgi:hypothetical protein
MNKQLTKKTIGIAASAALIATLAMSSSAFAGHNNGKGSDNGQKGSIKILSICDLNKDTGTLRVWTKIDDTSSDPAYGAELDSLFVQATQKIGTGKLQTDTDIPGGMGSTDPEFADAPIPDVSRFDDCRNAIGDPARPASCNEVPVSVCGLSPDARAVNATIEVLINGIHNAKEVRSECDYQGEDADGNCIGETLYFSVFETQCSDDPMTDANEKASLNVWNQAITCP